MSGKQESNALWSFGTKVAIVGIWHNSKHKDIVIEMGGQKTVHVQVKCHKYVIGNISCAWLKFGIYTKPIKMLIQQIKQGKIKPTQVVSESYLLCLTSEISELQIGDIEEEEIKLINKYWPLYFVNKYI